MDIRRTAVVMGVLWFFCGIADTLASSPSFEAMGTFGGPGIGRENFDRPVDVALDRNENIYVVDQGNNRIQVLDRRGRYLREWGGRGFAAGRFDTPGGIAIDPQKGELFVVDTQNHRIQKFDLEGKFLQAWGRLGSSRGDFNKPSDIAIDRKGYIYVTDPGNERVQKFDASGKFFSEWGKFSRRGRGDAVGTPVSIAYSDEGFGFLYVLESPDCRVRKFETDGAFVGEWPLYPRGEGAVCGQVRIRVEPRRYTVYIADTENDRILLFNKDGMVLGEFRGEKVFFKKPAGLFINAIFGEEVVVADSGNNLVRIFRRER